MRTLATTASAEGTLAIPLEPEKMTVSVWLIKTTGGFRKPPWWRRKPESKVLGSAVFSATSVPRENAKKHRTRRLQSWKQPWRQPDPKPSFYREGGEQNDSSKVTELTSRGAPLTALNETFKAVENKETKGNTSYTYHASGVFIYILIFTGPPSGQTKMQVGPLLSSPLHPDDTQNTKDRTEAGTCKLSCFLGRCSWNDKHSDRAPSLCTGITLQWVRAE